MSPHVLRVLAGRLLDRLEPGGHLFPGHAERLARVTGRAAHVLPTVYTRADEAPAGSGR